METVSRQRELGQESVQLRALNERLECYLQRVAVLEKENSTLRGHIQALKPGPDGGRRKELEAELEALRQQLAEGLRETDRAALQRDALLEEVRLVAERCCGEARLRTSAEKELAERRRWLEEEQRGRKGLEGKVRMFQDELGHLEEVQREERNVLLQEKARNSLRCSTAPMAALSPPDLRLCLGEVDLKWTEARDLYRDELTRLERVVSEAGLRQEAAREETRLNRHRLQTLRGELGAQREKRRQLEERLRQQNRASEQDTQRLQATVGELEQEKETLAAKMEQIVEEQRQLMQMKLALSLEVATYRALLDTEAQRIHSSAGARGLPTSLRDAQLGFPIGKGLSTEIHSAPVRLEAGNAWRSGTVTVPSAWKERSAFADAAPTRADPSADRAAGKAGNGSVATWPERDLVDGESAQDVPLIGDTRDEADHCPADDRSSETANQEGTETKLFTKPAAHPPLAGLLNGDVAEPGVDGRRPHLSPPLSTCPATAPEDSGHPNIDAGQFNGELRDPVEVGSGSHSLREAPDSAACRSDEVTEVGEVTEVALSRQGTSKARPGKETRSGSAEEAVAFIKEEELEKEEGTSVEDKCPAAADVPSEDSARPEKLETRRLSVEMERVGEEDDEEVERIREHGDEEMAAERVLQDGEDAPNTHETNDPVGRGSGDGAVEAGTVAESEAGYPKSSGAEEGQLSESFQEPEGEVARIEESQMDKKVCAVPARESLSSGEEPSAVVEEVVLMEPPAAEDGASEGCSPGMTGESIRQRPVEGSPVVEGEEVFGKAEGEHMEPRTEGMEAEPRSEAVDAPLRWKDMAEVKVVSERRFETVPTREEQEEEERAPTPVSAEEPADDTQEDRDGKPREYPEDLLTVGTPVEEQFEAAPKPCAERMEPGLRSEEMDAPLQWEEPAEDRMDSEERTDPERVYSSEEQAVEKRAPTPMGTADPRLQPQGDRDDEPRENSDESLSLGPRAEEEEELETAPERSTEGMETESWPETMDVPLRQEETTERSADSEGRASPVRVTTREEEETEERVPSPVCAEEPADHPQGDQDDESQEDPLCLRPGAEEEVVEQRPEAIDAPLQCEETAGAQIDSEGNASPETVTACEEPGVEVSVPAPVCADETADQTEGERDRKPREDAVESPRSGSRLEGEEEVEPARELWTERLETEHRPEATDAPFEWEETAEMRADSEGRASPERVPACEEVEVEVSVPTAVCAEEPEENPQGDWDGQPQEKPEISPGFGPRRDDQEEEAVPGQSTEEMDLPQSDAALHWEETAEVKVDLEGRASHERVTASEPAETEVRIPTPECASEPADQPQGDRDSEPRDGPEESLNPESSAHEEIRAAPEPWTGELEAESLPEEVGVPLPAEERMEGKVISDRVAPDEEPAAEQRVLIPLCADEPTEERLEERVIHDSANPVEEQAAEQRAPTPVCADEPAEERLEGMAIPDRVFPDEEQAVEQRTLTPVCADEPAEERLEGRVTPYRVFPDEEQAVEQRTLTPICADEPAEERLEGRVIHDSPNPDEEQAVKESVLTLTCADEPTEERLEERVIHDSANPDEEQAAEQRVLTLTCAEEPREEGLEGMTVSERFTPEEEQAAEQRVLTPAYAEEPREERLEGRVNTDRVTPDEEQAVELRVLTLTCAEEPTEDRSQGMAIPDRFIADEEQAAEQRAPTPVCAEEPREEGSQGRAIPDRVTPDEEQAAEQRVLTPVCAEEPTEEQLEGRVTPDRVTPDEEQALEQRTLTPVCADEPADHRQRHRESELQENSEASPDLGPRAREELEEPRPEAMDVPFQREETAEAVVDSEGRASPERVHEELEFEVSVPKPVCAEDPVDEAEGDRDGQPQEKPEISLGLGSRGEDQEVEIVPEPSTEGKEIPRSEVVDAPLRWDETAEQKVDSEEKTSYERDTTSEEPEVDEKVQTPADGEETAEYPQGDRDSEPREGPEQLLSPESTADEVILAAPESWTLGTEAESGPEEVGEPLPAEERMEGKTNVDIISPDEEQPVEQRALTPICAEEPANHPQGYREGEPRENTEDLVTPEFPAKAEEVPGAPEQNFSEEAGTVPGADGERKEWAGEFEDEAAQVPEPRLIQEDAGHVQEEGAELKTAAVGEEESIGAKVSQANLETGDQETTEDKTDLEVAEGELERGWADQAEIPGEVSEPEAEERGAEVEEELRASVSANEDSPKVKSVSLAEMELAEDEDTFRVEEVGAGEEVPLASAELTEPREATSAAAAAIPDGPEEKGISTLPAAPSLGEKPRAQEEQALRDSPEGAEDRALPPPSLSSSLPETPGSEEQSLAEWQEDVAQACMLPTRGTDVQEDHIPWEERPDGSQLTEGFPKESPSAGAEVEPRGQASYVTPDVDAEGSPIGHLTLEDIDGLETEEARSVEKVDNSQDPAIPNCPGDPSTGTQPAKGEKPATAAEKNASTGFQTPGILLPDQTEIQVTANPEYQRVNSDSLEVGDQERPHGKIEVEDQYAPSLELTAEGQGLEKGGGSPLGEREKVTTEADESGQNEPRRPRLDVEENSLKIGERASIGSMSLDSDDVAAGSGEGGIPVRGEEQPAEPQLVWEPAPCPQPLSHAEDLEEEALAGEEPLVNRPGKGKDEGDGGSVDLLLIPQEASPSRDLLLSPQSASSAQDTWTAQDQELRPGTPLVTNERHLNGMHDYREVPAKSDGRAAEMIATAYHYWSSEDE